MNNKLTKPTGQNLPLKIYSYFCLIPALLICVHIMGVGESARKPRPHPFHRPCYQLLQEDTGAFPSQMVHVMSQACPPKALWGSPFSRTGPKHPHSRMSRRMAPTQLSYASNTNKKEKKNLLLFYQLRQNSVLWLLYQDPCTWTTLMQLVHEDKILPETIDRRADSGMVRKTFLSHWTYSWSSVSLHPHIIIGILHMCSFD